MGIRRINSEKSRRCGRVDPRITNKQEKLTWYIFIVVVIIIVVVLFLLLLGLPYDKT